MYPTFTNSKVHEAGVTTIQCHPTREHCTSMRGCGVASAVLRSCCRWPAGPRWPARTLAGECHARVAPPTCLPRPAAACARPCPGRRVHAWRWSCVWQGGSESPPRRRPACRRFVAQALPRAATTSTSASGTHAPPGVLWPPPTSAAACGASNGAPSQPTRACSWRPACTPGSPPSVTTTPAQPLLRSRPRTLAASGLSLLPPCVERGSNHSRLCVHA